jgi:hypothetical protein
MQVKFGSFITEGSGKIGGHVLQGNNRKKSLRTTKPLTTKNSTTLDYRRQILSHISSSWRNQPQSIRNWCNNAASLYPQKDSLGNTYFLSGFNFYIQYCFWFYLRYNDIPSIFKIIPCIPNVTSIAPVVVASPFSASFIFSPSPATSIVFYVFATHSMRPSVKPSSKDFRLIATFVGGQTSPLSVTSAYQSRIQSSVYTGQIIYWRLYFWYYSNPISVNFISASSIVS